MAFAARMHRIYSEWDRPVGCGGMAQWPVRCVLVLLVSVCLALSLPLLACGVSLAQSQPLVVVEFRYYIRGAAQVYLVWGVNGWNTLPETERPEGTVLHDGVMHTLMSRDGDVFEATIQVPQGTIVDYGFSITRTERGATVQIWQGEGSDDYHLSVAGNSVVDVAASPSVVTQVATGHLGVDLPWLGLVLVIGAVVGLAITVARVRGLNASSSIDDSVKGTRLTFLGQAQHRILWGIVLFGLVLRLHAGAEWNATQPDGPERLWGDETGYNALALKILDGASLDWPGRVPLYPFWLAGVHWLTKGSYSAIPYVQALLGVTSILLTYHLGRRMFGYGPALVAAFLAATSYPLVRQSVYLLSEVLYTPIILIVMITLWDALQEPSIARASWAGFWVGLSALVRPTLLFFPMAAIVVYMMVLGRRRAVPFWGAYVGVALLVVLPWTVRNYVRYQAVFPLATSNGFYWLGSPEYYHLVHDEGRSFDEVWAQVLQDPRHPELSPDSIQGDQYWTARALCSIAAEPLVYIRYAVEKAAYYWIGSPYVDWGSTHPLNYALLRRWGFTVPWALSMLLTRAMIILALIAVLVLRRQWRQLFPVYAVLVYCTILHAATHAEARLGDPFQPLLMILVCGALFAIWIRLKHGVRDSQPSGPSSHAVSTQGSSEPMSTSGSTLRRGRRLAYVRDLLRELVSRELKLRYRRSILGMLWSLLNPLVQLLVFVLIFGRVLRLNIPSYPSFVFVGVLSWSWFQSALSVATGTITDNRELVKRPGFPMAILPVVTVTTHLIHFVLALPILLVFVLLNGGRLTGAVLLLPVVMTLQFLLILGLGYLTAAVHVTFRDTQYLLGVSLMLLFYLTPIFYDSKIIPERYQAIYNLNPMAVLVAAYRTILIQGQVPDLIGLLVLGVLLGLLVWLGYAVFRRASYRFVEEL